MHRARREPLGVLAQLLDAVLDQPHLVGLVVDREARAGSRSAPRRGAACGRTPSGTSSPTCGPRSRPPTSCWTRSFISVAARLVKVMARISTARPGPRRSGGRRGGSAPASCRSRRRRPPAAGPRVCSTASRCCGLSVSRAARAMRHGAAAPRPRRSRAIQAAAASSAFGSLDLSTMSTRLCAVVVMRDSCPPRRRGARPTPAPARRRSRTRSCGRLSRTARIGGAPVLEPPCAPRTARTSPPSRPARRPARARSRAGSRALRPAGWSTGWAPAGSFANRLDVGVGVLGEPPRSDRQRRGMALQRRRRRPPPPPPA